MSTPKDKLRRAVWLAFKASIPVGLGMLHTGHAASQTEQSLLSDKDFRKDNEDNLIVSTDYVFGRMMKTYFKVSPEGLLTIRPEEPRVDYQSWAVVYPHANKLIEAVERSFN